MYRKKKLGDILVQSGYISEEDLGNALKEQKRLGKKLGEILVEKEFVTEEDLLNKRKEKLEERGGFKKGIILKKVY